MVVQCVLCTCTCTYLQFTCTCIIINVLSFTMYALTCTCMVPFLYRRKDLDFRSMVRKPTIVHVNSLIIHEDMYIIIHVQPLRVDVSISDYHGERGGRREGGRAGGEARGPAHAAGSQCSGGQDTTGGR